VAKGLLKTVASWIKKDEPEKSLDYYLKARNGRKRDYVFDYGKSRKCPHRTLTALSIGGNWYRCADCNYAFDIVAAYQQPLHSLAIGSIMNALHFAKEFGSSSLQEVLRTPIGQYDGMSQKSALPEGMDFSQAAAALDTVNVNSLDGGDAELKELLESFWVSDESRAKRHKEIEGMDPSRRPELPVTKEALEAGDDHKPKSISRRSKARKKNN